MTKPVPGAKRGRPKTDKPLNRVFGVRMDEEMWAAAESYRAKGGDLGEKLRDALRRLLKKEGLL